MSVEVLTKGPETRLIDLATVKDRLDIADASQDVYLGDLIEEASRGIVSYVNRPLERQQYRELVKADGSEYLPLSYYPIESFADPTIDGIAITDGRINNPDGAMLFREDCWIAVPISINWSVYPVSHAGTKWAIVDYWAGYIMPDQFVDWITPLAVALNQWADVSHTLGLRFVATTAGDTGGAEPDWETVTAAEETITDGTVVWTAKPARKLDSDIYRAAWSTVHGYWNLDFRDENIVGRRIAEDSWLEYRPFRERAISVEAMGILKRHVRQT